MKYYSGNSVSGSQAAALSSSASRPPPFACSFLVGRCSFFSSSTRNLSLASQFPSQGAATREEETLQRKEKKGMKASKGRAGGVAARKNGISNATEEIDWELRPGGMLVQKRDDGPSPPFGPMIKIKVSHGSYLHEISVPAQATFGDLKRLLAQETGLEPQEQRLLFRGKEKDNDECLHMVGVKDASKVILLEDPASKERKLEEMKRDQGISRACEAVSHVRAEVDKLVEKVSALEMTVRGGAKVDDKEFLVLTELLMMQLLKLDGIEAEGEAKVQRRVEVRRVQSFVETLDVLKARNSNPFNSSSNTVSVTTKWETFDSGVGSLSAPPPMPSSTQITQNWEQFD